MKFHAVLQGQAHTVCGVRITPDKFAYDPIAFALHYADSYRCKKCKAVIMTPDTQEGKGNIHEPGNL